jgi:hypothetical protein
MSSDIDERLTKLENKLDLFLQNQNLISQQQDATQRAIALLKADFGEIVKDSIHSVLQKRAVEGYGRITGGIK